TVKAALAEAFSSVQSLDLEAIGQSFYATHPDSYDSLMVFADFDVNAGATATAEVVRNNIQGIILPAYVSNFDFGAVYGSSDRLSLVVNGGAVSQYPADPHEVFVNGQNTLTVLAQQFGHRWLSYAEVNPAALLRTTSWNWSFLMNAFGSVMEGNEIQDQGN